MSAAGGPHKALEAAHLLGMDVCQLFTKNNQQWKAAPLTGEAIKLFQQTAETTGISRHLSHASYLLNFATANDELWQKSQIAFGDELDRAEALGLAYLVVHPGSASEGQAEKDALLRVSQTIDVVLTTRKKYKVMLLLETTAGQGKSIGHEFEQLAAILKKAKLGKRVGVCADTCHIFAAGYGLSTQKEYKRTWEAFDSIIGLDRLQVLHVNDSVKALGSRVDRHAGIGMGQIGEEGFKLLVKDKRLADKWFVMETPKGKADDGKELDAVNLAKLRGFLR